MTSLDKHKVVIYVDGYQFTANVDVNRSGEVAKHASVASSAQVWTDTSCLTYVAGALVDKEVFR